MIYVQTWQSGGVSITDMTHAYKRGKTCKQIRYSGWVSSWPGEREQAITAHTLDVLEWARLLDRSTPYETASERLRAFAEAGQQIDPNNANAHESEIRGGDAPRVPLVAGVPGIWSASADHTGVCARDLVDTINEPTYITAHQQKDTVAYQCAAKVWRDVSTATSANQAADVLRRGGCRLHFYCAVD